MKEESFAASAHNKDDNNQNKYDLWWKGGCTQVFMIEIENDQWSILETDATNQDSAQREGGPCLQKLFEKFVGEEWENSNCYSIVFTTKTAQSFMGGWVGVWSRSLCGHSQPV